MLKVSEDLDAGQFIIVCQGMPLAMCLAVKPLDSLESNIPEFLGALGCARLNQ